MCAPKLALDMARIQSEVHREYDEVCLCGGKGVGGGGGAHTQMLNVRSIGPLYRKYSTALIFENLFLLLLLNLVLPSSSSSSSSSSNTFPTHSQHITGRAHVQAGTGHDAGPHRLPLELWLLSPGTKLNPKPYTLNLRLPLELRRLLQVAGAGGGAGGGAGEGTHTHTHNTHNAAGLPRRRARRTNVLRPRPRRGPHSLESH